MNRGYKSYKYHAYQGASSADLWEDGIDLASELLEVAVGDGSLCSSKDAGCPPARLLVAPSILIREVVVVLARLWLGCIGLLVGRVVGLLRLLALMRVLALLVVVVATVLPAPAFVIASTSAVATVFAALPNFLELETVLSVEIGRAHV